MFDERKTDYYKINRRLRLRKWRKYFGFLWVLLIIPLGFILYFVSRHGAREKTVAMPVKVAGPMLSMPMRAPANAPSPHPSLIANPRPPVLAKAPTRPEKAKAARRHTSHRARRGQRK